MVSSELWFGASDSFYNGVIKQSLKLGVGTNYKLDRQFVTPTSVTGTICTTSWWMKKSAHGTVQSFIQCRDNQASGNYTAYWTYDGGFSGSDHHSFRNENDSIHVGTNTTVAPYRDSSGWYHVVIRYDTTQSTSSDRIRIYINGALQNSTFTTTTYPSQNHVDTYWNNDGEHLCIFGNGEDSGDSFDGYIAEFNWVDGQSLPPETFGESKNGVWIPKAITLSTSDYGLNGCRYTFEDSSDIGKDTSGVGNDLDRVSNLSAIHVVPDSPENNMCTLNFLANRNYGSAITGTYSEGNLKIVGSGNSQYHAYGSMRVNDFLTDGCYFEVQVTAVNTARTFIGIVNPESMSADPDASYAFANKALTNHANSIHATTNVVGAISYTPSTVHNLSNNDIIGIAIKGTKMWIHFNGTYSRDASNNVGNPSADSNPTVPSITNITTADYFPYVGFASSYSVNFGQNPTFNGYLDGTSGKEVGTETPDAGEGVFKYPVPTGFKALCTANLPEPTISPNEDTQAVNHFGTLTYSGNATNGTNIVSGGTGIGGEISFTPDWLWIKRRDGTNSHVLVDSTRGSGSNDSFLALLSNDSGGDLDTNDNVRSLDTNGFTLDDDADNTIAVNNSSQTYIAWNWLANGTAPTKTYKVKVVSDSTDYGHGTGSNKYQFFKSDGTTGFGTNGVDIDLQEGGTYTFDWSDSSAQGHPIRFSLTNDGTHSSGTSAGSEYTTGVTKNDSAYTTTITVASGVANLYYYCQNHSGMGAEVRTNTTHGSTNFDGSILSVSNANTTAGFSIVKYTGTGSSATIGHGLGVTPQLMIVKNRDASHSWAGTYHHKMASPPEDYYLTLNGTGSSVDDATIWNDVAPNSTVFSVGTASNTGSSDDFIGYMFKEIDGYSKIGSFKGNESTNGAFVYCGFRPQFILTKALGTSSWHIADEELSANPIGFLRADTGDQYQDYNFYDILSNGFKVRDNGSHANAKVTHVFIAFANIPFKYANAR